MLKFFFIFIAAAIFIAADSFSAKWGKTGDQTSLILMLIFSPLGYLFFAILNKRMTLGASATVVNTLMILGAVVVGRLFFTETLSAHQYIGIFFGLIAITLLAI